MVEHAFITFATFKPFPTVINMADQWMLILILVGVIVLAVGLIGGYLAYLIPDQEFFPVWMFLAFIGIILTLVGIAMGMGEKSSKEE